MPQPLRVPQKNKSFSRKSRTFILGLARTSTNHCVRSIGPSKLTKKCRQYCIILYRILKDEFSNFDLCARQFGCAILSFLSFTSPFGCVGVQEHLAIANARIQELESLNRAQSLELATGTERAQEIIKLAEGL